MKNPNKIKQLSKLFIKIVEEGLIDEKTLTRSLCTNDLSEKSLKKTNSFFILKLLGFLGIEDFFNIDFNLSYKEVIKTIDEVNLFFSNQLNPTVSISNHLPTISYLASIKNNRFKSLINNQLNNNLNLGIALFPNRTIDLNSINFIYMGVPFYQNKISAKIISESHSVNRFLSNIKVYSKPKTKLEIFFDSLSTSFDKSFNYEIYKYKDSKKLEFLSSPKEEVSNHLQNSFSMQQELSEFRALFGKNCLNKMGFKISKFQITETSKGTLFKYH